MDKQCVDQKCVDALDRMDERAAGSGISDEDVATVREALERLREERDGLSKIAQEWDNRAAAAEAEVRRLTEGIRAELRRQGCLCLSSRCPIHGEGTGALAALLSASPSDGGGAK